MKIHCTHCDTAYEMAPPLLRKADYRVACSACHQVFRVVETEEGAEKTAVSDEEETALDAEMDQLLAEMEETLAGLETIEPPRSGAGRGLPAALDTGVPPEMAALRATEVPPELLMEPDETPRRFSWGGFTLALLLALALAVQLAWRKPEWWIDRPAVRDLVARWCLSLGCTLPKRPAEPTYRVLDGRLEPTGPGRYRLRLLLKNEGGTRRPPPALQLTLSDERQRLLARRTFDPPTYLPGPIGTQGLAAGETLELELELAVPSERVSGYEIDLIPPRA